MRRRKQAEEILDTLLLIARNVLQFGRLAAVMRQYVATMSLIHWPADPRFLRSGQSIFSRPKPIDINAARRAGFVDLEYDSDEETDRELNRPLVPSAVLFDAQNERGEATAVLRDAACRTGCAERDTEDVWAELG